MQYLKKIIANVLKTTSFVARRIWWPKCTRLSHKIQCRWAIHTKKILV